MTDYGVSSSLSATQGLWAVIVNWNNASDTGKAISSLLESSACPEKIVVVDNGSTDDSVSHISSRFPQVTVLQLKHNAGFGSANNEVIRSFLKDPNATHLLLLNNDAVVERDTVRALVEVVSDRNDMACASPLILTSYTDQIWFCGGKIDWWRGCGRHDYFHQKPQAIALGTEPYETHFVTGCVLLLSRNVLELVGYFDSNFFMYGEDVDLSIRLAKFNVPMLVCPGVKANHKVASTSNKHKNGFVYYHMLRNRTLIARKHARGIHLAQFLAFYPSQWLIKATLFCLTGKGSLSLAIWQGMRDGILRRYGTGAYTD